MKLSIEEIPDPRNHHPPWRSKPECIVCGGWPRYFAVITESATKAAYTLCNDCAIDEALLDRLGATAERIVEVERQLKGEHESRMSDYLILDPDDG
jgi:hypothetical protein